MDEGRLREILNRLDVNIVMRTHDDWLACNCPFAPLGFHDRGTDRDASFFAKIDLVKVSGFHCFTCKQHGRISTLVRLLARYRGVDYGGLDIEADMEETPSDFGDFERPFYEMPEPEPLNKAMILGMYPLAWEHPTARTYLVGRGISEATSRLLELQYDDDEKRVIFPVYDGERNLYGFTGRTVLAEKQIESINEQRVRKGRTVMYSKVKDYHNLPKEQFLLGEQLVKKDRPFILVEGLFALAHFIEIGCLEYYNVVASMGSALSDYQRDRIILYNQPTYLFYDNDKAGVQGIFGQIDKDTGKFKGGGALDKLKNHVPTYVPLWEEGQVDPDKLVLSQVFDMVELAEL